MLQILKVFKTSSWINTKKTIPKNIIGTLPKNKTKFS